MEAGSNDYYILLVLPHKSVYLDNFFFPITLTHL